MEVTSINEGNATTLCHNERAWPLHMYIVHELLGQMGWLDGWLSSNIMLLCSSTPFDPLAPSRPFTQRVNIDWNSMCSSGKGAREKTRMMNAGFAQVGSKYRPYSRTPLIVVSAEASSGSLRYHRYVRHARVAET